MSCSLESVVDAIEELYHYRRQKALYECMLEIRQKKRELSEIQYARAAEIQRNATIELHKCRLKLAKLRNVVDVTEPEYGQLFEDLLKELEDRITDFANKRKVRRPL